MPQQAPLRIIKRCRLYQKRGDWKPVPRLTRGIYVLYQERKKGVFDVVYIGVGGTAKVARRAITARLDHHHRTKDDWTHYSFFEVHDNISGDEIRELESLLLEIFFRKSRSALVNIQSGTKALRKLASKDAWRD
jgi:hypothetical protein